MWIWWWRRRWLVEKNCYIPIWFMFLLIFSSCFVRGIIANKSICFCILEKGRVKFCVDWKKNHIKKSMDKTNRLQICWIFIKFCKLFVSSSRCVFYIQNLTFSCYGWLEGIRGHNSFQWMKKWLFCFMSQWPLSLLPPFFSPLLSNDKFSFSKKFLLIFLFSCALPLCVCVCVCFRENV